MKKNILRIIFLILVIINVIVIFHFSAQDGKESSKVSQKIVKENVNNVKTTNQSEKKKILNKIEKVLRKLAHVLIYTSLGIWSISFVLTLRIKRTTQILTTTFWGIILAGIDEINQHFTSGRTGKLIDVFIDTIGVVLGILIVLLIVHICKKIKENLSKEKGKSMKSRENGVTLVALAITIVVMMIIASSVIIMSKGDKASLDLANEKKTEAELLSIKEEIKTDLTEKSPKTYQELIEMLRKYGTIENENDTSNATLITNRGNYTIYIRDIWNINVIEP